MDARRARELALLVDGIREYAILLLDPEGVVLTWNAGGERLKGYSAEEIVGRSFAVFYTDEDRDAGRPDELLGAARRDGRVEDEGWRVRRDGSRFWASVTITAIREPGEPDVIGFGKVVRDLTAWQATRERLERTNQELDRFAAVAAHDLQEPLRTVGGFSGLLRTRFAADLPAKARDYVDHIESGVARMSRLVEDLLGYARAVEPSGVAGDTVVLADAVAGVVGELGATIEERGAEMVVDVARDVHVHAEARDVEAALRNLLSNAVKFADFDAPRVHVAAALVDRDVRVEVADNGIGIDPRDRPRLFQPFQRLASAHDRPGTGLGLAIAQRVVERNGGAIGVESVAGAGSRFWFTLPAA